VNPIEEANVAGTVPAVRLAPPAPARPSVPVGTAGAASRLDFGRLREALAAGLVEGIVVDHRGGRDGLGDVDTVATLSRALDIVPMCDDAELVTVHHVVRLSRRPGMAVVARFPRTREAALAMDDLLPVDLGASGRHAGVLVLDGAAAVLSGCGGDEVRS
jgi:hypothetical protein